MPIDPRVRPIVDYSDGDRAIGQLEQNLTVALGRIADEAWPILVPTEKKTANYAAKLDDLVTVDTTNNDVAIILPVASSKNAGRAIGIVRVSTAHNITLASASGQVQQGAIDTLPTAVGRYLYISDGVGWWRPPVSAASAIASAFAFGNTTGVSSSTTLNLANLQFSGAGIVSVGFSGGTIIISAAGGGGGGGVTMSWFAVGNTTGQSSSSTINSSAVSLDGGGAVSVGYSAGSIVISAPNTVAQSFTENFFAVGNTTGQSSSTTRDARTLSIQGTGGVSVGYSNGSLIISGASPSGAAVNFSAGTTSSNLGSVIFSNSNNVSFGLNGGTITATATFAQSFTENFFAVGNTTGQSSSTTRDARTLSVDGAGAVSVGYSGGSLVISAPNTIAQSFGESLFAVGNTTGQSSSTTRDARTLSVQGAGNVSVGYSAGSLVISGAGGGGGPAMTWLAVGNTTGQSSSTTLNSSAVSLDGAGGVSVGYSAGSAVISGPPTSSLSATGQVSISTNGSTISIGVPLQFTKSRFNPFAEAVAALGQHGNGSLHLHPIPDPDNFQFNRVVFDINVSMSTGNSSVTGALTLAFFAGIYTRNASTLSLLASSSTAYNITASSTNNSASFQGDRIVTLGWTTTIPQNDLWMGIISTTATAGSNKFSQIQQYVVSDAAANLSGLFNSATTATVQDELGLGYYSAATSAIPGSIAFSQINGTASMALRPPLYRFLSQTV